jgi:hypothetical protein
MSEPMETPSPAPPPRAFTQGLGVVFQAAGVTLFLSFFTLCCLSGLLSMNTATGTGLGEVAFHGYSAQRAVSISVVVGIFLGMALAGIGLGLQAERRAAPVMAVIMTAAAGVYWLAHALLFAVVAHAVVLTLICLLLAGGFVMLCVLAWGALREMRAMPPPKDQEILPADYKVPYSHLHQDPPEVRLERELDARRQRLEAERRALESLEQKLHRKQKDQSP